MTKRGQTSSQTRARTQTQGHAQTPVRSERGQASGSPRGQSPRGDSRSLADALGTPTVERDTATASAPTVTAEKRVATAGRNGESHVAVAWIDVWIGNAKPCRFDVATLADHALEVVVEQGAYRRVYTGVGTVATQPLPVVPIGTWFSVTATDTTTGERVEEEGVWRDLGGRTPLWERIKRLFWKG